MYNLIQGDCLEEMDRLITSGVNVDMVLTDPPYGTTACKWDSIIPFEPMWKRIKSLIKPNGGIILFGREPFSSSLIQSNKTAYKHKWVWNKKQSGSFQNAKYMPLQIDEDILCFTANGEKVLYYPQMRIGKMRKRGGAKEKSKVVGTGLKDGFTNYSNQYYPTNILEFANPRREKLHPTQKPTNLLEYLIKTYTNEGETVLDFTMGSGSTGVACLNTNRNFIGIELDQKYYDIAKNRLQESEK